MFADEILDFLELRKNFIDGVCVSGGEPTVHRELPEFCEKVKKMGLLVKIDTNGSNPGMLKTLMENKLVDYIAMDVKGPLATYKNTAGVDIDLNSITKSIGLIMESGVDHEFRTTVVPGLIDADDMREIAQLVKGARRFAIQQFSNGSTLDTSFQSVEPYPEDKLEEFREIVKPFVGSCEIRGT
jgi:pyruvate formate lyase activating enzyme